MSGLRREHRLRTRSGRATSDRVVAEITVPLDIIDAVADLILEDLLRGAPTVRGEPEAPSHVPEDAA